MSKSIAVALCALACATSVLAGTGNPIAITLDAQLTAQKMNASLGNFYSFAVSSSKISSFYEYRFQMQMAPLSYVTQNIIKLAAYWKMPDANNNNQLSWQAMTPASYYELSTDAVASTGQLNMVVDPKQLYQGLRSFTTVQTQVEIGVLVTTTSTLPAVLNGLFSMQLTEVHCPQVQDGDVPVGTGGTEITGTCSGTMSRCMVVANMQYHNHRYLLASVRSTGGNFYSARMHNAALLSFNDVSYFDGSVGPVTVRTCLTNSSCEIEADYYYIEMRTTSSQTTSSSYGVTMSQQAAAFSTATASLITVAAAAAAAFMAARSH